MCRQVTGWSVQTENIPGQQSLRGISKVILLPHLELTLYPVVAQNSDPEPLRCLDSSIYVAVLTFSETHLE